MTPLIDVTGGPSLAEHGERRLGLGGVVERRRRAVGVDLGDVAGGEAGVLERQAHARRRARRRRATAR